jgi:hypothetical protein
LHADSSSPIEVGARYGRSVGEPTFTAADLTYLHQNYRTLEAICRDRPETADQIRKLIADRLLPQPSYVLDDGTELFPPDYFRLPDEAGGPACLRTYFSERYYAAGGRGDEFEEQWDGYMSGIYGVCLKDVVPETMVRKTALVDSLTELLDRPQPHDDDWCTQLRREVEELDQLERPFSPDYDRSDRFAQPPSRDRLIAAARARYPAVFASDDVAAPRAPS